MGNPRYGIGSAIADAKKGYERQEERSAKRAEGAKNAEASDLKLEQIREEMKKEGSADALRLLLRGDTEGAMTKYNSVGEDKMSELEFDKEDGLVSWVDGQGNQRDAMIGHLMLSAGLDPNKLDTPDDKLNREKELIDYKAQTDKKYGIGVGSKDNRTAYIQNMEYTMQKLTGGDSRKAFELMQLSKSDPQEAYARVLLALRKENADKFEDEKMSEEQMSNAAKEAVTSFRSGEMDRLMKKEETQPIPQAQSVAPTAAPVPQQSFDPDNPSSLWR